MPAADPASLTERQRKWFAAVSQGLERDTGRTLEAWAQVARACPETAHRKRLAWLKAHHGLGQNHGSLVLNAAFPGAMSWSEPEVLDDALWRDPVQRSVVEALKAMVTAMPDVVVGQRKGFTAFSRSFQFAAAKPTSTHVLLGVAIAPDVDPRLAPAPRNAGWSDRLKAVTALATPAEVDTGLQALLKAGWDRS